ncbi:acyl-CoA synthetase [Streptomyces sp. NPDC019224]|uniref:acyl-CoA synthetase n=1 Tax=Streptomyces sp. NPDC019224 TaxID=3154484 RepID=UPI0034080D96
MPLSTVAAAPARSGRPAPLDRERLLGVLPDDIPFDTSGTTGTPVTWWRTREQLLDEAAHLADLLRAERADALLTYAPTRHLYGYLFGALIPALTGLPVHRIAPGDPLPRFCARPLIAALPATWWQLDRQAAVLREYAHVTVVHSTAWLPASADAVRRRVPRLDLYELHGSTETGLVGVRSEGEPFFRLAPDVELVAPRPGGKDALTIRSPRTAAATRGGPVPAEHTLDDVVEPAGPRAYRLTGRRTRLVKVNGLRIDLDRVESALRAAVPSANVVCAVHRDPTRGEWYDVLAGDAEPQRAAVAEAVRRLLTAAEAPRAVRLTPPGELPERARTRTL